MPYCPDCGNQHDDNSQFCNQCGRKFNSSKEPHSSSTIMAPVFNNQIHPPPPPPTQPISINVVSNNINSNSNVNNTNNTLGTQCSNCGFLTDSHARRICGTTALIWCMATTLMTGGLILCIGLDKFDSCKDT
jgi:ribosomal protein L37E